MKKNLLFSLMLMGVLLSAIFASQSIAAVFHVTNATEFQNALNTAKNNGEDDTIYLAAGTYAGNFTYHPPDTSTTEPRSLTIQGESGTSAEDVILDGQNSGMVLLVYDSSEGPMAEARITGVTVQNGNNSGYTGGIYAILYFYNISITNCIIKNNKGQGWGGGVFMENRFPGGGTLTLENNLILDNTVTDNTDNFSWGGGAFVFGNSTGNSTIIIRNNIIVGNAAQGTTDPQGGGLWIGYFNPNVTHLIGNTIYDNTANRGGGVFFAAANSANIYNNIIYGNTATQGGDIYFATVTNRVGHNNNYSNMHGTWTDSGNNLNTNPLFVDSANNDFHLQPTSPMINAGTMAVPNPPGLPSSDFEGNPRVIGTAPDIGAYEWSPVSPSEGTIGIELTITGSGYGANKGKVLVGNVAAKVLEWIDSSIRCQLSKSPPLGTYDVTIQPKGVSPIIVPDGFTIVAPEIDSIEPSGGSAGDEITINGFFFGTKKGKITLDGKNCKAVSWMMASVTGDSEIRFMVPKGLAPGTYELKVTNGVGSDTVNFIVE